MLPGPVIFDAGRSVITMSGEALMHKPRFLPKVMSAVECEQVFWLAHIPIFMQYGSFYLCISW